MLRVGWRSNRKSRDSAGLAERLPKPDIANFDAMACGSKKPCDPSPAKVFSFQYYRQPVSLAFLRNRTQTLAGDGA